MTLDQSIINIVLEYGFPGVIIVILALVYWQKDQQLKQLYEKMFEMNAQNMQTISELNESVARLLDRLSTK